MIPIWLSFLITLPPSFSVYLLLLSLVRCSNYLRTEVMESWVFLPGHDQENELAEKGTVNEILR